MDKITTTIKREWLKKIANPSDRFLWASDFIQTVDEPSQYASEVWKAAQRDNLHPERTAAEHLDLTLWSKIEQLQKPQQTAH